MLTKNWMWMSKGPVVDFNKTTGLNNNSNDGGYI